MGVGRGMKRGGGAGLIHSYHNGATSLKRVGNVEHSLFVLSTAPPLFTGWGRRRGNLNIIKHLEVDLPSARHFVSLIWYTAFIVREWGDLVQITLYICIYSKYAIVIVKLLNRI